MNATLYLLSSELVPSQVTISANIVKAYVFHTERRKTKRVEREAVLIAGLADGGMGNEANSCDSKICMVFVVSMFFIHKKNSKIDLESNKVINVHIYFLNRMKYYTTKSSWQKNWRL
jgi:hypothetical protein